MCVRAHVCARLYVCVKRAHASIACAGSSHHGPQQRELDQARVATSVVPPRLRMPRTNVQVYAADARASVRLAAARCWAWCRDITASKVRTLPASLGKCTNLQRLCAAIRRSAAAAAAAASAWSTCGTHRSNTGPATPTKVLSDWHRGPHAGARDASTRAHAQRRRCASAQPMRSARRRCGTGSRDGARSRRCQASRSGRSWKACACCMRCDTSSGV